VGESVASTIRARDFRKNLTRQEARLWLQLRLLRAEGFHFRRQTPFLGFYLDFVCFKNRLIVELDGSQHADDVRQADHDAMRDAVLQSRGFRTLRFWNSEVDANLDGVVLTIQTVLGLPPSPSWGGTADPKDRQGGGVGRVNGVSARLLTPPPSTAARSALPMKGREDREGGGE
jgi:very-short-patch-repair endonuclease